MRYHTGLDATIAVAPVSARRARGPRRPPVAVMPPPAPSRPVVGLVASGGARRVTAFPSPFARAGQIVYVATDPAHCLACGGPVAMLDPSPVTFGDGRRAEKGACARCDRPVIRFGGVDPAAHPSLSLHAVVGREVK